MSHDHERDFERECDDQEQGRTTMSGLPLTDNRQLLLLTKPKPTLFRRLRRAWRRWMADQFGILFWHIVAGVIVWHL